MSVIVVVPIALIAVGAVALRQAEELASDLREAGSGC